MAVRTEGRWSVTTYKVIRFYYYFALLEVNLETGRTHQIRVHLTNRNHPIVGDKLYNTIKNVQANVPDNMKKKVGDLLTTHLKRQALHAWKLEFEHPHTKVLLSFTAAIPDDIIYTLEWLEQYFAIDNDRYDKKLLNR
jgi:23S rRNA pseudouridine1911/1915/1917 synthase